MKLLTMLLVTLTPAAALADGFNWKGSCQGPDGMLVQIKPSDDDVSIFITQGRQGQMIVFDGRATSDILSESASMVTFRGEDTKRHAELEMTVVRRGEAPSRLSLNGLPHVGLTKCSLKIEQEQ